MNLLAFDLNLLKVLDALLRENSTTLAGQRLGLSQSAVSSALNRLRGSFNDPLFVRHGQSLRPTEQALSLKGPIQAALEDVNAMLTQATVFDPASATGTVRLSGSDFFAELLMPKLADVLSDQAPNLIVQLTDLVPHDYLESLDRYNTDIALMPQTNLPEWSAHADLFNSSFVVVARRRHSKLRRSNVKPGQVMPLDLFCTLDHVLFSPEGKLAAMGDAALAQVGRRRKVSMTLPVFSALLRVVSKSDQISLVPRQLAKHFEKELQLTIYEPPMPIAPACITMVWHRRNTPSPTHQWVREKVVDLMRPLNRGEAELEG
jgi:DNA-binding transcriptional LysR family regulator